MLAALCWRGWSREPGGALRLIHKWPCVRDEVEAYRAENDWLSQFIAEQCEVGKDFTVKASDLQLAYRTYCDESGEYCRRSNDFKTALEAAGFKWHKSKLGATYTGLRLGVEVL